jgi:hypothetical protein
MAVIQNHNVGRELLDVPFPAMILNMASAIAQSQTALDRESIEIMKEMGDVTNAPVTLPKIAVDDRGTLLSDDSEDANFVTSMIGAGFQPTFYQFAESVIEVKMTITATEEKEESGVKKGSAVTAKVVRNRVRLAVTPINANYTNKYNYSVEGASLLRTRLVPLPPNTFIQRLLDLKSQAIQATLEVELRKAELALAKVAQEADKNLAALEETEK